MANGKTKRFMVEQKGTPAGAGSLAPPLHYKIIKTEITMVTKNITRITLLIIAVLVISACGRPKQSSLGSAENLVAWAFLNFEPEGRFPRKGHKCSIDWDLPSVAMRGTGNGLANWKSTSLPTESTGLSYWESIW